MRNNRRRDRRGYGFDAYPFSASEVTVSVSWNCSTMAKLLGLSGDVMGTRFARGRVGGRPKALSEADLKKARALLRSGDDFKVQIAKNLK